jgi:hypothetical protein
MEAYANSPSSPGLVAEYSAGICLDGEPSAQSSWTPTQQAFLSHGKTTGFSRLSRFGMTCAIDIFTYQRKIGAWTKNTDTAESATALYAGSHSSHETKGACKNAAQPLVAGLFRQRRRPALARSAECNFFQLDLNTNPVPVHAGRCCASLAERSIRWLKSESALLSSVARSLQGVCATRQTELLRFSVIRLRNCGLILNRISSQECHGTTTEKGMTNGA